LLVSIFCFANAGLSQSQTFNSGSNGSDGALNLTTPGTVIFDPKSFNPPLNPTGDNVYNFTTINIASGVTVKLTSKVLSGPVYWLAQGAVTIGGTIDLAGESGPNTTNNQNERVPAAGGAGGYSGGLGGNASLPPTAGNGPGGSPGNQGVNGGTFTGSQYLIPLIGGSGGGGSGTSCSGTTYGGGGGGGGGALLIASSVSITITPAGTAITAAGGNGGNSCTSVPGGSGGAVRLVAPTMSLSRAVPLIDVRGGGFGGGDGIVRLEAFTISSNGTLPIIVGGRLITSPPFMVVPPTVPPSALKVTSLVVGGVTIPINANPFSFPDATINSSTPVTVNVQAQFIPIGTIPKIIVMSETGTDQTVNCAALQGTLQQSTCSASITFPTGGSRGFVKATWTQ